MGTLLQDLRYAARSLRRQPGFTLAAVLTLAVGIGANTAIFSVVNATLLRPFPYKEPDRLMRVSLVMPSHHGGPVSDDTVWSYPKFETLRQNQHVFEDLALYRSNTFNLAGLEEAERIRGEAVTAAYFPVLRISAQVGRTLLVEEDLPALNHMVAVLSYTLWGRHFGLDPSIIGKTVTLDNATYTVVGVLPSGFEGLTGRAEIFVPISAIDPGEMNQRWSHSYELIARLKPGISAGQAKSAVTVLGQVIDEAHPLPFMEGKWGAKARTLSEARIDPALRRSVLVLFGSVASVLLIACVNIANLLLARGSTREREIAIRLAVGAGRRRLVRQLLTESVLLAAVGAGASLLLAYWGVQLLRSINPVAGNLFGHGVSGLTLVGLSSIRLDGDALLFTFGAALLTGVLFGLLPALQASRSDVAEALKSTGMRRHDFGGARALASKSALIVTEVALALVLLVASGLMIKSFWLLLSTRTGVDPEKVLTVRVDLPYKQYTETTSIDFFEQLETRIRALPGVQSVGLANCPPLAGGCNGTVIWFRDRPPVPKGSEPMVGVHWVSPAYFQTMRVRLLRGRWFTPADRTGRPKVMIVNETAARKFWPNEDPIGKHIAVGQGRFDDRAEIVGIVGDIRYGQMNELPQPDTFIPFLQSPRWNLLVFARSAAEPASLTAAIRSEVRGLDKNLPIYDVKTMRERIGDATARARFSTILLGIFASIALILAAVGIYGVMAYAVTQRTREIGIRIALGAEPRNVVTLVMRRAFALTLAGILIGTVVALMATRVLESLLYEVKPGDPATFAIFAAALGVVALLASYLPARRAARVDPMVALRFE